MKKAFSIGLLFAAWAMARAYAESALMPPEQPVQFEPTRLIVICIAAVIVVSVLRFLGGRVAKAVRGNSTDLPHITISILTAALGFAVIYIVLSAGFASSPNYTGTWTSTTRNLILNPDGSGTESGSGAGTELIWHRQGGHIVIVMSDGQESVNAKLGDNGKSLIVYDSLNSSTTTFRRK